MQQPSFWPTQDGWSICNKVGGHFWNSKATVVKHPVILFVWQAHWNQSPLSNSFSPWNPAVHEEAKERMFAYKVNFARKKKVNHFCLFLFKCVYVIVEALLCDCSCLLLLLLQRRPEEQTRGAQVSGLSWVRPGSTQPFSKDDASPHSWTCNDAWWPQDGGTRAAAT